VSTINALLDPTTGSRRYQRGGFEIETGFEVEVSYEKFKQIGDRTIVEGKGRSFKLVLDQATGLDDNVKIILEIVSHPAPMLERELNIEHRNIDVLRLSTRETLKDVELALRRLRAAQGRTKLRDVFPAEAGYRVGAQFADWIVVGESIPNLMRAHYTAGVPIAAMHDFIRFVDEHSFTGPDYALRRHLRSALVFGDRAGVEFSSVHDSENPVTTLELAALRGHMALIYTQISAILHRNIKFPDMLTKSYTLIALRTAPAAMRASLPDRVATWLDGHSALIENLLTERFAADNLNIAKDALTKFRTLLDVTQFTYETNGREFTARDYLHNAILKRPSIGLSQNDALNVRTAFSQMDGDLSVVELRGHGGRENAPMQQVKSTYLELEEHVRTLDNSVQIQQIMHDGGDAATFENLRIPFDTRIKKLDNRHALTIENFARYVGEQAEFRHKANAGGLLIRVKGGGNGSQFETVGTQRARAVHDVLRPKVERELQRRQVPQAVVRLADPTFRDKTDTDGIGASTGKEGRRAAIVQIERLP
jgi:hypothetical protein